MERIAVSKPNTNCIINELLRMFCFSNNMIINVKHSGMFFITEDGTVAGGRCPMLEGVCEWKPEAD
ncbi:MAG TPA: hypothetical protein VIH86_13880 [Puia sp.]|jgi:hypothetical protein